MTRGSAATDARRATRRITYAPSTLRVSGTRPVDVTVYDISETGIRFACNADLAVGDELSIGLAGFGSSRAYVAWRREGQFGCDFVLPISADAAASAFNTPTVVQLGSTPPGAGAPADRVAAGVDQLYARHRGWAFPRDVTFLSAALLAIMAAVAWAVFRAG